MHHKKTHKNI